MKIKKIYVPIYDWNVWFVDYSDGKIGQKEKSAFHNLCKRLSVGPENMEHLENNIFTGYGGGDCYTQAAWRNIIVLIGKMKNDKMRLNLLNHEKRHAVDEIMVAANIHDAEACAYLDGYISEFIK